MDVADLALTASWRIAGWGIALPLLVLAAWRADWSRFAESDPVHAYLAAVAGLTALWCLRGDVGGFAFHLLGSAGLALATGAPRALVAGAVVVALTTWLRAAPVANAAWVWLTLVALPIGIGTLVLRFAERVLPPNFFAYVFVAAFGGGALALVAGALGGAVVGVLAAGRSAELAFGEHASVLAPLAFGEGTLTGMLLTLAVVYRPQWVATFDDRRYLRRR
jgi:uncharacterized membrane protein